MMARSARVPQCAVARWGSLCALVVALLGTGGCANCRLPRIDPSGERIFLPAGAPAPAPQPPVVVAGNPGLGPAPPPVPGPQPGIGSPPMAIVVSPSRVIAPVGSEVVLIAGVGTDSYLKTNQRVEWTIASDSVGEFLSPGVRRPFDLYDLVHGLPRKADGRYVVNTTLFHPQTVDRGTPTPTDDIVVVAGQSWVSVYSPTEGTSQVTAYAPSVGPWDRRQQTASIYWVDAQWRFPPPANTELGGRNTLVTVVTRQTTNSPLVGWPVRYEVVGGPEAGFGPDGSPTVEVLTNEVGEARVEIFQKQESSGANQVNIQVIRPPVGSSSEPLTVGTGSTTQSWGTGLAVAGAATGLAAVPSATATPPTLAEPPATTPSTPDTSRAAELEVSIRGPETATVGSSVQFEISVTNRGTTAATRLLVTDRFDSGLQHAVSSSPIERDLVDLQPGGTVRLNVSFQTIEAGQHCQDVEVTGAGGLRATARACVTVADRAIQPPAEATPRAETPQESPPPAETATAGSLSMTVRSTTPDRRRVGETAHVTIELTNRGQAPISGLTLASKFPAALEPLQATEGKQWLPGNTLGWTNLSLDPGRTARREVEFKCAHESPRACVQLTLNGVGIETLSEETCFEIIGETPEAPQTPAASATPSPINVEVADTVDPLKVNSETTMHISVENKSASSQFNVVVSVKVSDELKLEGISGPVQGSVLPGVIRFAPIKELRAGEPALSYELRLRGVKAGAARVDVEVASQGHTRPATAEQTTQVIP